MKQWMMLAALACVDVVAAQDTLSNNNQSPLTMSGYAELYYSFDLNKPADHVRPGFLYNHNRHNEFNVNLAYLKAAYQTERVRANLAIATGTYMQANYSAENDVMKIIYEANAGYKLSRSKNWWFDIGIMPSHIGFESAIGKDCWTLTRSLVAENSPYFEAGAKLGYNSTNGKLHVSVLALNGWQRISRLPGNSMMSWGAQVLLKPSDKLTLNYSSFFGSDTPDTTRRCRIYHNLYSIFQLSKNFGFIAGFDIGTQQVASGKHAQYLWYSPVLIFRYTPSAAWGVALRGEYYSDKNGVIIMTGSPNGFKTTGLSCNIDYKPTPSVSLRLEGRTLISRDEVFYKDQALKKHNTALTFSTAVNF